MPFLCLLMPGCILQGFASVLNHSSRGASCLAQEAGAGGQEEGAGAARPACERPHSCSPARPRPMSSSPGSAAEGDIMLLQGSAGPPPPPRERSRFSRGQEKLASVFLAVPEEMAFYSKVSWETEHAACISTGFCAKEKQSLSVNKSLITVLIRL